MKRYTFRISVLGILVLLGGIAVAYAQRGAHEADSANNPLRESPAMPEILSPMHDRNPPTEEDAAARTLAAPDDRGRGRPGSFEAPADTIPDAAELETAKEKDRGRDRLDALEERAATEAPAEASAEASSAGPALLAPSPTRQPEDRYAPIEARTAQKTEDRSADRRNPAPRAAPERAASANEEPARFQAEPFDDSVALPLAKVANPPAARTSSQSARALRTSATTPPEETDPGYAPAEPAAPSGSSFPRAAALSNNAGISDETNLTNSAPNNALTPISQRSPAAQDPPAAEGTGQPGAKQLEGPQSPQVTIEKAVPPEIQVGRPATFKTIVRNTGAIPAGQVEIHDMVPKGTRLLNTTPRAQQGPRGEIVWTLGTLRPGEESTVEMELMPTAEGEIGSIATVHFGADASAKSISTRPDLAVQTTAPTQALIGEKINLTITVTNPGSGVATGVVIEEHLPAGLQLSGNMQHLATNELEYNIGVLKPGESKKLDLELTAAAAGSVVNQLSVRADGNLRKEDRLQLEVVAPKLDIAMEGPKKRYLERPATYQLSVINPGTAPAQGVELAAYLPPGMKFVSANNQGHYDEATRAVYWRLEQLPTRETGTVELVTLPVEAGQQSIKLRGAAQRVQAVEKEQPVVVEGIAAVMFQVVDSVDPIEVGGETTYEVRVVNQGTKPAGNVQISALLPREMQPLSADGPTRYSVQGNNVVFEDLARLAPKAEATYHLRVKGVRPGDLRVQFQLKTAEMQRPVTTEESTQVYADEWPP